MVHVWDVVTGKELASFKGHTAAVTAVAFAPNGKTIASASADTTALVWDVSKLERPAPPAKPLQGADLEACWQSLASDDAAKAFAAICDLTAAPKDAVALLKDRVKPAAPLDMKRVQDLLRQLDDDNAAVRQQATAYLSSLGEQLLPVIDKTLAANPPLEVRKRLEQVRATFSDTVLRGEKLQAYRARRSAGTHRHTGSAGSVESACGRRAGGTAYRECSSGAETLTLPFSGSYPLA